MIAVPNLVHMENADEEKAGHIVRELAARLRGCAVIISARFTGLGESAGWGQVELKPFDKEAALQQLREELGTDAPGQGDWPDLVLALGFLPLALHLAAGYLRRDDTAASFLQRLRVKALALPPRDPADHLWEARSRALISDTFELSLAVLQCGGGERAVAQPSGWRGWFAPFPRKARPQGEAWRDGFAALGHAPAAGFGASLGAAIASLDADMFDDMVSQARRLSLLDRVARGAGAAYRLHPLLAELVRAGADRDTVVGRMTEWFVGAPARGR